ncbi:MAG: family ATPase, partial [Subtercola sp.]|nr:family ATPase [Subtercola sp.]
ELTLRALCDSGRPGEALAEYEAHRRRLRDELGTTPSTELVRFHTELLRSEPGDGHDDTDDDGDEDPTDVAAQSKQSRSADRSGQTGRARDSAGLQSRPPVRLGVKAPPNALIGRERDIAALNTLIGQARLVTILGAGGLGKTRLAQALSNDGARGETAVVFVELASVRSPVDLLIAIAQACGIREAQAANRLADRASKGDLNSRILSRLREQPTLLVLDNCEHIVDAVAAWVADSLEQVAALTILATSRAPLQVAAERVYPLEPLSSVSPRLGGAGSSGGSSNPGSASSNDSSNASDPDNPTAPSEPAFGPAVQLFAERARAARPSVILKISTVERLCDRLDGMPLAIELAAARVRSMTVDEIERRLNNRFALLTGGDRSAPERHQTLLAVIDWSWNLLTDRQRHVVRRLSLFVDGFSDEAAEVVAQGSAADIADDLDALVTQSLLSVTESDITGRIRYRMLETVREFGQMALVDAGEDAQAAAQMARWASDLAAEFAPRFNGETQVDTFRRVRDEQDNLLDILRRALEHTDARTATFVFSLLCSYWTIRGEHWEVVGFGPAFLDATTGYDPTAPSDPDAAPDDRAQLAATEALTRCLATVAAVSMVGTVRTLARARSRLKRLARLDEISEERLKSAAHMIMHANDQEAMSTLQAEARDSADLITSAYGYLMSTQLMENEGDVDRALYFAQRGYEKAVLGHDVWTQSMTASMIAQLHGQAGDAERGLLWAFRARKGLILLNAEDDLQQLEWFIAMNRLTTGQLDEAEKAFRALAERVSAVDATSIENIFTHDLVSIGWLGLAEIARQRREPRAAMAHFHNALDEYGRSSDRVAPWYQMIGGAYLAAYSIDGWSSAEGEADYARAVARRVRARILAGARLRPQFTDKPVLGCVLVGLSALLLNLGERYDEATALRLLALAEKLSSRQDSPAMRREQHVERAVALCGPDAVADARARVADLSTNESAALAFSVLKESRTLRG